MATTVNIREVLEYFQSHLENCRLCPRQCGVNRLKGERGYCRAGADVKIASYCLHMGEEPPISGTNGSGTIFFSHCSMSCVYCQNYPISQLDYGNTKTESELVEIMLELQSRGAHNINLVTATHFLPRIVPAIAVARSRGLTIPIVYNTSGYERVETIRMLAHTIDIYLADMRYSNNDFALKYSNAPSYVDYNRLAIKAMYEAVGDLRLERHIATRGLIIRHLILPNEIAGTAETLKFISGKLSTQIHISLMSQYFPANRAHLYRELNRKITKREYARAVELLTKYGFERGWIQEIDAPPRPIA